MRVGARKGRGAVVGIAALLCALAALVAGCGSGGGATGTGAGDSREQALNALELSTEASSLQSEMGKLVVKLVDEPSAVKRRVLERRLAQLQARARRLVTSADVKSTYKVRLAGVGGSKAKGSADLVQAGSEVAIDGRLAGANGAKPGSVAIYALGAGRGASVCPPGSAAAGADHKLSAREAADFYGRPAVDLGEIDGANGTLLGSAPSSDAAPLPAHVVVVSSGASKTPIACGAPEPAPSESTAEPAAAKAIAATSEAQAAMVDVAVVVSNPTSKRAREAKRRVEFRMHSAGDLLRQAVNSSLDELGDKGEITAEERAAVQKALGRLKGSKTTVKKALKKLKKLVATELAAQRKREAQRKAALKAKRQAETSTEPAPTTTTQTTTTPTPAPAPTPSPTPAPAPAPSTGGGGSSGPSIAAPG